MPKNKRILSLAAGLVLALLMISTSCSAPLATGYRTYSLPDKGIVHLSFEFPASFYVKQVQLFDDTGYERMDIYGPYSLETRDRTSMWVVAQRYPNAVTIGSLLQSAMSVAAGLPGYHLVDRSTTNVNGITAEQFSYFYYVTRSDYEKNVLGFKPAPTITREVFFTSGGLQWTVAMSANEARVDTDTPGFEHLLATLTMLLENPMDDLMLFPASMLK